MKLKYEVAEAKADPEVYDMMGQLIEAHHKHLIGASIKIAYYTGWSPDDDGHLTLGRCKIASELDRRLHGCQIIIVLNRDAWDAFDDRQKRALLDHELCHAESRLDKSLEPVEGECGRRLFRVRKHDIEEFRDVVQRHGIWKGDLRDFAETVIRAQKSLPFSGKKVESIAEAVDRLRPKRGSGIDSVTISTGSGEAEKSVTLTAK